MVRNRVRRGDPGRGGSPDRHPGRGAGRGLDLCRGVGADLPGRGSAGAIHIDCLCSSGTAERALRGQDPAMIRRGLIGFPVALIVLATLSLYRETLGFPLFYLGLLTSMLFWITQATSWNILSGYSGYFSFGQAAYVGVGAYTTAVLFGRHGWNFYLTILVSAGLSAMLALAIGIVAFRLRALRGE